MVDVGTRRVSQMTLYQNSRDKASEIDNGDDDEKQVCSAILIGAGQNFATLNIPNQQVTMNRFFLCYPSNDMHRLWSLIATKNQPDIIYGLYPYLSISLTCALLVSMPSRTNEEDKPG